MTRMIDLNFDNFLLEFKNNKGFHLAWRYDKK